MKPPFHKKYDRALAGYLLLEVLVFMSLTLVILGLAYSAYWRCVDNAKHLQKNADDILAAVHAGERWRDDVRHSKDFSIEPAGIKMNQAADIVEYRFEHQSIWRRSSQTGRQICLLSNVKTSAVRVEPRRRVRALKWEIELQSRKSPPYIHPLFTFEAVPAP